VGLLLSYGLYTNERARLDDSTLLAARALMRVVDAELIRSQSTAQALAASPYLRDGQLAAFYQQAREVLQTTGVGNHFVLTDLQGQQLVNTARAWGEPLPRIRDTTQLQRVASTGLPAISDLFTGAVLRTPVVSIDVPVLRNGTVVYVLSVGLVPNHFGKLLTDQKLPPEWIAGLLDAQHTIVARSLNPESTVGEKARPDFIQRLQRHPEGTLEGYSREGQPTFSAYTQSPVSGWTLGVGMKSTVLYQALYRQVGLVVLSYLSFWAGGTVLAWLFTRYIRLALEGLGSATEAAALGDRGARAHRSGIRQLDRLIDQFNSMQDTQRTMEEQVHRMAFYDPLTQLANRRLLHDRLGQTLAQSKRSADHGGLMFLDLDNFKPLNDTYGHSVGDLLLQEVAQRLKACVRDVDTVGRIGGDEFVVLINGLSPDASESRARLERIADKIRLALAAPYQLTIPDADHPDKAPVTVEHHCTVSIGVALFLGRDSRADDVLRRADAAMYLAKHAGRNTVRFHEPGAPHVAPQG